MTTNTKTNDKTVSVTSSDPINMKETGMQNSYELIDINAMNPNHQEHTSRQQKTKFKNVPIEKNKILKKTHKNCLQTQKLTELTPGTENRTKTVPKNKKTYRTVRFKDQEKSENLHEKHKGFASK